MIDAPEENHVRVFCSHSKSHRNFYAHNQSTVTLRGIYDLAPVLSSSFTTPLKKKIHAIKLQLKKFLRLQIVIKVSLCLCSLVSNIDVTTNVNMFSIKGIVLTFLESGH